MIESLGADPINSLVQVGISEFTSVLRKRPSRAFGDDSGRYPRPYTSTRGLMINKDFVDGVVSPDLTKGYIFQFNPQTITDVKSTLYEVRPYPGLPYNEYVWAGGGERIITFQLFLDNTPQSKQREFRPESYGSKLANEIKTRGEGYSYNPETGKFQLLGKGYFFDGFVDEMENQVKGIGKSIYTPADKPSRLVYKNNGAYSNTRVDERGILPEVEKIQSFLYPAPLDGEQTPLFAEGGIVSRHQFRPPAMVILTIGPLYLEGYVKSAPVTYKLFDKDLTPLRATIDIEFAVCEFEDIERQIEWRAQ